MDSFSLEVKDIASSSPTQSGNHLWLNGGMAKSANKIRGFSDRFNLAVAEREWDKLPDAELCKKFGKGNTTIWNWKNAIKMPAIETAIDVALVLGVCVEWLLTGRGPRRPGLPDENGDDGDGTHLDISQLPHGQQVHLRALVHSIQEPGSGQKKVADD